MWSERAAIAILSFVDTIVSTILLTPMNTTQLIEELSQIGHSTATAVKSTSINDRLTIAFKAGLKAFAAAFLASFLAAATAPELPQTAPSD